MKKYFTVPVAEVERSSSCLIVILLWPLFLLSCGKEEPSVKIIFTGDLLLDRGVKEQIDKKGGSYLFEKIKPLFQNADYVVANLECPVTDSKTPVFKKFVFRGSPAILPELKQAGVTHLVMANNHTYDQGRKGLSDTYKNLLQHNLTPVGYGKNQSLSCAPVLIEKAGLKIALFSSVLLPLEGWPYLPDSSGICQASVPDLKSSISNYKRDNPSHKIVLILHWGTEFQKSPTNVQREDAKELINAGADAIIGHHPHVVQEGSVYKDKPVYYSIGNFIFDQKTPDASEALLVELTFSKDTIKSKTYKIDILNCRPELK